MGFLGDLLRGGFAYLWLFTAGYTFGEGAAEPLNVWDFLRALVRTLLIRGSLLA